MKIDCLMVFDAWRHGVCSSILATILNDCHLLLLNFDVFDFICIRQTGNTIVDALAKASFSLGDSV